MKHAPRPQIEEHYHIQELIDAQQKRVDDRVSAQNRAKLLEDREDYIKDSKLVVITDFWCKTCKKDFKAQSIRMIEKDWSNPNQRIAFYRTKCEKKHWCIRLITDKSMDSFWSKSKLIAKDRANHSLDTLQPWQTGFNLMYGKK